MHVGGQFDTDTGLMLTVPPNTGHMLIWGTFAAAAVKGGPDQASVLFTSTNGGSSYNTSTDFRCGLPAEGKSCGEQEWVELRNGTILALIRSNNRHKMAANAEYLNKIMSFSSQAPCCLKPRPQDATRMCSPLYLTSYTMH